MQSIFNTKQSSTSEMRVLLASVADLLDQAVRQIAGDQHEARSTIARAHCILTLQVGKDPEQNQRRPGHCTLIAWQMRRIREYMNLRLAAKIRVADLSALVGLSEAHFARAFKNTLGVGPHTFLMRLRIEKASTLMLSSAAALSDISLASGFADQAHLCKVFRRATGMSPSVWRRENYVPQDSEYMAKYARTRADPHYVVEQQA